MNNVLVLSLKSDCVQVRVGMSVNTDMMNEDRDWSDYRYQTVQIQHLDNSQGSTTTGRSETEISLNPLEPVGGLANNEVAELVYLETIVALEFEDETGDQNVATTVEFRGSIGANTSGTGDVLADGANEFGRGEVIETDTVSASDVQVIGNSRVDSGVLQIFSIYGGPPFDDQGNGLGGNIFTNLFHAQKNFRDLAGRGPVLDQTDDITYLSALIYDDSILQKSGIIKNHMVWDVAEMDEAGREFSVPRR